MALHIISDVRDFVIGVEGMFYLGLSACLRIKVVPRHVLAIVITYGEFYQKSIGERGSSPCFLL